MAFSHSSLSWIVVVSLSMMIISYSSAFQFQIGGSNGWVIPPPNDTQTYIEWAATNRFHIGDTLYFKYKDDSVLVVNRDDYLYCNVTNPVAKYDDGNTLFRFDRYGFFYFISGEDGHCKSGQRVVIRVMVHPGGVDTRTTSPSPSPSTGTGASGGSSSSGGLSPGSSELGPPTSNSSSFKVSVRSYFITLLGSMAVVFYLFI